MPLRNTSKLLAALLLAGLSLPLAAHAAVQATRAPQPVPVASDKDVAANQEELIRLLRLSPTLTTVVARDPSLLANQEYVARNNPQLGQFLTNHPEIARNPDFYLFTHLKDNDGQPEHALEREVWPGLNQTHDRPPLEILVNDVGPFVVFIVVALALMWLIRLLLQNRRWSRIFKLQTEVHNKLIEKFSGNSELLVYMGTDAGKRFLEAAPLPVDFEQDGRVPSAVSRILTPLQIGIVLSLLGIGILALRHVQADLEIPLLVVGTIVLMPGIGFMISAGVTWLLAGKLGLITHTRAGQNPGSFDGRDGR